MPALARPAPDDVEAAPGVLGAAGPWREHGGVVRRDADGDWRRRRRVAAAHDERVGVDDVLRRPAQPRETHGHTRRTPPRDRRPARATHPLSGAPDGPRVAAQRSSRRAPEAPRGSEAAAAGEGTSCVVDPEDAADGIFTC